jgi:CubicO group peptidase (beta-lactamase class C family)
MNISDRSRRLTACLLIGMMVVSTACSSSKVAKQETYSDGDVIKKVQGVKNPEYWPTDQWNISTPEAQGMDSSILAKTLKQLPGSNIHSMVLVRNGYLVAEAYNADTQPDKAQDILSATKSITSALTGIAIQDGKLKGTSHKLSEFFPQLVGNAPDKSAITIDNLLTMTSGLKWDNEGEKSSNEMVDSEDWVKYVLGQPVVGKPGKDFMYSNGNAHVMSAILQKVTNMPTSKYAEQKIFEPLGIHDVEWYQDPQNIDIGAFSVHMKARDMAKIGFLYLHDGQWNNKEVIPAKWVEATLKKHDDAEYADGSIGSYGYFWWLKNMVVDGTDKRINMFYAAGSGGQRIYVLPEQNMVAVFTSNTANSFVTETVLAQMVGAIRSDKPLPVNPDGVNGLNDAIKSFKAVKDKQS